MSKIYELLLERIEFYGSVFFNAVTPAFLDNPDYDMEKISYQLMVGIFILGAFAWSVVWYADNQAEKNKLRESRRVTFGWKGIEQEKFEDLTSESALEVMLKRQEEQMARASRLKHEMVSGRKKEKQVYNVNNRSLPTFFKG